MHTVEWAQRFDDYELHKTMTARQARLAPLVTERDQAGDGFAVIGNAWSRAMFGGLFYVAPHQPGDLPVSNLVFVQSRDGNTVTRHPSALGGGEADTHLIYEGLTRVAADAMRDGLKARPWITPLVMDDPADLRGAFGELRRLGVERISCIGGRALAGQLLDAGLVQDLYLTTGTKTGGEPGTPVYDKPLNGREIVRKHGTGEDAGVVFEHVALS